MTEVTSDVVEIIDKILLSSGLVTQMMVPLKAVTQALGSVCASYINGACSWPRLGSHDLILSSENNCFSVMLRWQIAPPSWRKSISKGGVMILNSIACTKLQTGAPADSPEEQHPVFLWSG
ncbi:unnamed protein product [Caretta caretta]